MPEAMTPDRWARIKEIFAEALEHAPEERAAFVRCAAKGDDSLIAAVQKMLAEAERDTGLLAHPIVAIPKPPCGEAEPRFRVSTVLAQRFRIVRFIARGGMGEVYEAEDLELGEHVALKAIRPRVAADPELRLLFKREIQMARRVTHPNVCRIFDLAQHEDTEGGQPSLLLSMELIDGQTLAERLRVNGPLTFRGALPLIEDIAAGLQAVHDSGIVHGDLKPANVMLVTRPGEAAPQARVMDFGMAFPRGDAAPSSTTNAERPAADDTGATITVRSPSPALRGGTPDYFAPEQAVGGPASTATDVYAFALVISDMLGVPPDARLNPDAEHMPGRWARILRRCLKADPAGRYARPADVVAALRAAVDHRKTVRRVIVGACAVVALLTAAKRIDFSRSTANRLLFTEGYGFTVRATSPDGKFLAVTSWDTGDLALRDAESAKIRRLTHKPTTWSQQFGGAYDAVFSPDGREIAYQWNNSRTDSEIRLIGTDGKSERALFHRPDQSAELVDWSPDRRQILVRLAEAGHPGRLALLSVADGSIRALPAQPSIAWAGGVLFGTDSNSIVFDVRPPGTDKMEIHRLLLNGGESTLVSNAGSSSLMGWSPDRRRLIFSSDRRGRRGIWAVPVSAQGAGGEPLELIANARNWERLAISRTGSFFYRQDESSVDVYTAVLDVAAGRTVSAPQRVSERFVGAYAYPNWSEDGKRLVFDSNRDMPTPGLGIFDLATGRVHELRLDLLYSWRPQWVEHGAAIIVVGKGADGREGHFRVDPRTGAATLFHDGRELAAYYEGIWTQDETAHFNRFMPIHRGLFRWNPRTGERRMLYVPPPGVDLGTENLALSPDGSILAFQARKEGGSATLMVVPAEGGEAKPLFTVSAPDIFPYGSFTWTPDSRRILAVTSRSLGRSPTDETISTIWQVPADGGTPQRVDFPPMFVQCLRLNPDGKTIAFQVRRSKREIWVMQNFL